MFQRLGHIARSIHENLNSIVDDDLVRRIARDIPDAKERLNYISNMTEEAAHRVLTSTEEAIPLQDDLNSKIKDLQEMINQVSNRFMAQSSGDALMVTKLTNAMTEYLKLVEQNSSQTKVLLTDIMMAQDFQDLTGQVIKKVTKLTQDIESQIVSVLIEYAPEEASIKDNSLLNGPQIDKTKADIVTSQDQVDDLLDSLGF